MTPLTGPSGDVAGASIHEANKVKRCNGYCIGKTFIKVAVPSLIIGGLIAGAIFYGVTRIEGVLKDQIAVAVTKLEIDLKGEIATIMNTFNSIITANAAEISSATSTAINEGVILLNNSLQTSIHSLNNNITEAIANAVQQIP